MDWTAAMSTRESEICETETVEEIAPSIEFPGWTALGFDIEGFWLTLDVPPVEHTFKVGDRVEMISTADRPWDLVAIWINDGLRIPLHHDWLYMIRPFL
jgi:hypothetical protein